MVYNSIVISGTTAVGKTRLAANLAAKYVGAVLSVDSRQVYMDMNLGTGKDLDEYVVNGVQVPYFLVDLLPAGAQYDVHRFQIDFYEAWDKVCSMQYLPIVCGGTMLYLATILQDYSYTQVPVNLDYRGELELKSKEELCLMLRGYTQLPFEVDIHSKKRLIRALEILDYLTLHPFTPDPKPVELCSLVLALQLPNELRRARIQKRLLLRIEEGMITEVDMLLQKGLSEQQLKNYGLEYKYTVNLLNGTLTYAEYLLQLEAAIYRFSKQQTLFLKKMEREGIQIHWIDAQMTLLEQMQMVASLWEK